MESSLHYQGDVHSHSGIVTASLDYITWETRIPASLLGAFTTSMGRCALSNALHYIALHCGIVVSWRAFSSCVSGMLYAVSLVGLRLGTGDQSKPLRTKEAGACKKSIYIVK